MDSGTDEEEPSETVHITENNFDIAPFQIKPRDVIYFDFHCVDEDPEICFFTFPIDLTEMEGKVVMKIAGRAKHVMCGPFSVNLNFYM
ncbi:unnamed protein product [Echinostoma caproni]|uniref:Hydrocephalus-inducing protein homolog n=1 Tax=Echinostoma caproni TaxID=27848 RepID=A0A183AMZ6_9TREM|nr:unnamed protein product [Echinostoma caproni]